MLGYFVRRSVIDWRVPSCNDPRGTGVLDGVLGLAQKVELEQRAEAMRAYHRAANDGTGVRLDPVLRAHLGLDSFK